MITIDGTAHSNELKLLRLAASVEQNSEHPLAEAVMQYARSQQVEVTDVAKFEAIAGSGVQGQVGGRFVRVGTQMWGFRFSKGDATRTALVLMSRSQLVISR